MSYIKANKSNLNGLEDAISLVINSLDKTSSEISTFVTNANNLVTMWKNNVENYAVASCGTLLSYDSWSLGANASVGLNVDLTSAYELYKQDYNQKLEAKKKEINDRITEFQKAVVAIDDGANDALTSAKESISSIIKVSVSNVIQAIDDFESIAPSLEQALKDVAAKDGYTVDSDSVTVQIDDEEYNVEVVKFVYDGKEYTIAELVNAFYTTTGTMGNAAVTIASSGGYEIDSDGNIVGDEFFNNLIEGFKDVNARIAEYLERGFFSVARTGSADEIYKEVTGNDDLMGDYLSFLKTLNQNDSLYEKLLNGWTGADRTQNMALSGLVWGMGGYSLVDFIDPDNTSDEKTTPEETPTEETVKELTPKPNGVVGETGSNNGGQPGTTPGGTGQSGGQQQQQNPPSPAPAPSGTGNGENGNGENGNGGGSDDNGDGSDDTGEEEQEEKEEQVEVKKPDSRGDLPETIEADYGEKDYDALAREQFEAQGDEKTAENRAKITEEANNLFENEDKTELIKTLKEYGYTEMDINDIIKDRNLVTSALIEGDQRQQLAKIAKELAKKDGIEDFDSKYDDGQCCHNFYDGTNEALLENMSKDPTVATAKEALNDATTKYTDSVKTAQEAITKVNDAEKAIQTTTDEIVKDVAADTKNWSTAEQKKYNAELKEAQDKFINENGDATKWDSTKVNEYQKIENDLKDKYVEEVQKDSTKWSNEQIEKYNKSVDNYNESLKDAKTKYEATTAAKTAYDNSKTSYEKTCETFIKKVKEANKKDTIQSDPIDGDDGSKYVTDPSTNPSGNTGDTGNTGGTGNTVGLTDDEVLNIGGGQ